MDDLEHILRFSYRRGSLSELGSLALPWEQVVGEAIAKHCQPRRLKQGILFLNASSPAWAQQLGYFQDEIREKVNSYLGKSVVRNVRVEGRGFVWSEPPKTHQVVIELTAEERSAIESRIDQVSDDRIRQDLKRLMELHVSVEKNSSSEQDE